MTIPDDWFEEYSGQKQVLSIEKTQKLYLFAKTILDTFEKDEAQGYRSKDRQFAIDLLRSAII